MGDSIRRTRSAAEGDTPRIRAVARRLGNGVFFRQTFARPTSDMPNSLARVRMGVAQTLSYSSPRVRRILSAVIPLCRTGQVWFSLHVSRGPTRSTMKMGQPRAAASGSPRRSAVNKEESSRPSSLNCSHGNSDSYHSAIRESRRPRKLSVVKLWAHFEERPQDPLSHPCRGESGTGSPRPSCIVRSDSAVCIALSCTGKSNIRATTHRGIRVIEPL